MSPSGRLEQISTLPSAGGSAGSVVYPTSPESSAVSQVWHTPVIGFATRTAARRVASLAWARALTPAAAGLAARGRAPARVALHPDDAASPAVLAAAGRVVQRLAGGLAAQTYATALRISATRRDVQAAL